MTLRGFGGHWHWPSSSRNRFDVRGAHRGSLDERRIPNCQTASRRGKCRRQPRNLPPWLIPITDRCSVIAIVELGHSMVRQAFPTNGPRDCEKPLRNSAGAWHRAQSADKIALHGAADLSPGNASRTSTPQRETVDEAQSILRSIAPLAIDRRFTTCRTDASLRPSVLGWMLDAVGFRVDRQSVSDADAAIPGQNAEAAWCGDGAPHDSSEPQ
jgi:hypothetical protein